MNNGSSNVIGHHRYGDRGLKWVVHCSSSSRHDGSLITVETERFTADDEVKTPRATAPLELGMKFSMQPSDAKGNVVNVVTYFSGFFATLLI
jgi:hypothetical protein